jgi:hypothetical protein
LGCSGREMTRMYINEQINSTLTTYRITNITTRAYEPEQAICHQHPLTASNHGNSFRSIDRNTITIILRRFDQPCATQDPKNRHTILSNSRRWQPVRPSSRNRSNLDIPQASPRDPKNSHATELFRIHDTFSSVNTRNTTRNSQVTLSRRPLGPLVLVGTTNIIHLHHLPTWHGGTGQDRGQKCIESTNMPT